MERPLIDKLVKDLKEINFEGAFCLCGYGEPLLHKDLDYIVDSLGSIGGVEIITNGDTLTKDILTNLETNVTIISINIILKYFLLINFFFLKLLVY